MSPEVRAYINNMLDAGPILINNSTKAVNVMNYSLIDPNTGNEKTFTSCDIVIHNEFTGMDTTLGYLTFNTDDNSFIFTGTGILDESIHGTYIPTVEEVIFENDIGVITACHPIYSPEYVTLTLAGLYEVDGMEVEETP